MLNEADVNSLKPPPHSCVDKSKKKNLNSYLLWRKEGYMVYYICNHQIFQTKFKRPSLSPLGLLSINPSQNIETKSSKADGDGSNRVFEMFPQGWRC
jgi:hypothetical protein